MSTQGKPVVLFAILRATELNEQTHARSLTHSAHSTHQSVVVHTSFETCFYSTIDKLNKCDTQILGTGRSNHINAAARQNVQGQCLTRGRHAGVAVIVAVTVIGAGCELTLKREDTIVWKVDEARKRLRESSPKILDATGKH